MYSLGTEHHICHLIKLRVHCSGRLVYFAYYKYVTHTADIVVFLNILKNLLCLLFQVKC